MICPARGCKYRKGLYGGATGERLSYCDYESMTDGPSKVKWYYDLHGIKYPTPEQLKEMQNTICPFYDGSHGIGRLTISLKYSLTEEDGARITELYLSGYTDSEIAKELNTPVKLIIEYRKRQGINGTWRQIQMIPDEVKETIRELNQAGETDTAISHIIDVNTRIVSIIRREMGLPTNKHFGGPKDLDWDKALELYKSGLSDFKIGQAIGCSDNTIRCWRIREELGPNHIKRRKQDE